MRLSKKHPQHTLIAIMFSLNKVGRTQIGPQIIVEQSPVRDGSASSLREVVLSRSWGNSSLHRGPSRTSSVSALALRDAAG